MKRVATSRLEKENAGAGIIDEQDECHIRSHEVCIEVCVICAGLVHIDHDFLHATDSRWKWLASDADLVVARISEPHGGWRR